jgi:hypothetical protein
LRTAIVRAAPITADSALSLQKPRITGVPQDSFDARECSDWG